MRTGASLKVRDGRNLTALHYAVMSGIVELVSFLYDCAAVEHDHRTLVDITELHRLVKDAKHRYIDTSDWVEETASKFGRIDPAWIQANPEYMPLLGNEWNSWSDRNKFDALVHLAVSMICLLYTSPSPRD